MLVNLSCYRFSSRLCWRYASHFVCGRCASLLLACSSLPPERSANTNSETDLKQYWTATTTALATTLKSVCTGCRCRCGCSLAVLFKGFNWLKLMCAPIRKRIESLVNNVQVCILRIFAPPSPSHLSSIDRLLHTIFARCSLCARQLCRHNSLPRAIRFARCSKFYVWRELNRQTRL